MILETIEMLNPAQREAVEQTENRIFNERKESKS